MRSAWIALAGAAFVATPGAAQIDYRNLDDDRPTTVEDAWTIERYAFEFLAPWRAERHDRVWVHSIIPELAYGVAPGVHVGLKLPLAWRPGQAYGDVGLSGVRAFGMMNILNETSALPALALRLDATAPVGGMGGDAVGLGVKGIATRSFGLNRLHANAGVAVVSPDQPALVEALPRWFAGVAGDHTLLRSSMLLLGEVLVVEEAAEDPLELRFTLGVRRQVTPTLVLDAGFAQGWAEGVAPAYAFTAGLSHAFAWAALMPGGGR